MSQTRTTRLADAQAHSPWLRHVDRYRAGQDRSITFRDLILQDAGEKGGGLTILDIGCGRGFDDDQDLQRSIAAVATRYIGIEPDTRIQPADCIHEIHRCLFEDAPLPAASVDLAYAFMVLEHIPAPEVFFARLWRVLKPGGIFWGITVDARHWFCKASLWTQRLRIKDQYLRLLRGTGVAGYYENYPVFYRCNRPEDVGRYTRRFSSSQFINFARIGQCDRCFPRFMHQLVHRYERRAFARGRPGSLLALRLVK